MQMFLDGVFLRKQKGWSLKFKPHLYHQIYLNWNTLKQMYVQFYQGFAMKEMAQQDENSIVTECEFP
jgi:hypothetical protein